MTEQTDDTTQDADAQNSWTKSVKTGLPPLLIALFVILGGAALLWPSGPEKAPSQPENDTVATPDLPTAYETEYTWDSIGPELVSTGAINLTRLRMLHRQRDDPLSEEEVAFFTEGTDEPIEITEQNKGLMLNTLWALGITNQNPLLEDGRMGSLIEDGQADRLASTGGWTLGSRPGGDLLNSATIIELTPEQQQRVRNVTERTYRPCCNNHAAFPDCNHGAAALGLAQLLASQGASTAEIEEALKQVNALWFPRQYSEVAIYFEEVEGTSWEDVDAGTVLDREYSSASGWRSIHQELQDRDLLPEDTQQGGSCGI